ncbi:MAG TPA: NAD(P)(+) transhydrogenase (Re/Si-specific) subunit beta, partial [Candidatus Cybelea sp.]
PHLHIGWRIPVGGAIGAAFGLVGARRVKMTAMPQMVALFNGVGGGAVFLIAWAEFRLTHGYSTGQPTYFTVFSLFAAIVGSVSFWGSNIAFGKLQELLPGRPITLGRSQQLVNGAFAAAAVACAVAIAAGSHSQLLFIQGLRGLSGPTTAVRGNRIAAVGMTIAVIATLLNRNEGNWALIVIGVALGTAVGVPAARQVKMTAMPQMVALFNGVGGGAVFLISWSEFRLSSGYTDTPTYIAIFSLFAAIVGSVSFWGSNIAFGKLQEIIPGRPISFGSAQQIVNLVLLILVLAAGIDLIAGAHSEVLFIGMLIVAALLGNAVVLPIGGADMPVVISLLNSFTGVAVAITGFEIDSTLLIICGALVGASGTILTVAMSRAMNRPLTNVLFGAFGAAGGTEIVAASGVPQQIRSTSADDDAVMLAYASKVIFVPGYGMAVAQAQHSVKALADQLEKRGVKVLYAIHPVAGRMPGHMNVLLAEANVPYNQLLDMEDANLEFPTADVALVIGANDVTNPAARTVSSSPIYGMPILDVDRAANVVVLKRSMRSGFAGIENPLYELPNTSMLFGDAKASVDALTAAVKAL